MLFTRMFINKHRRTVRAGRGQNHGQDVRGQTKSGQITGSGRIGCEQEYQRQRQISKYPDQKNTGYTLEKQRLGYECEETTLRIE